MRVQPRRFSESPNQNTRWNLVYECCLAALCQCHSDKPYMAVDKVSTYDLEGIASQGEREENRRNKEHNAG